MQIQRARTSYGWKEEEMRKVSTLIAENPTIVIFALSKIRSNLIHQMRTKLRGLSEIVVIKKKLFMLAARRSEKPELTELVEELKEPIGYIFSKVNAFKLSVILMKNRVAMYARQGDTADFEVVVPESNTGLAPGPVLSEFGKMKIPTRIDGGTIWIAKDTLVAKKGDEISPAIASLLTRLEIKPVLRGLDILAAHEDGKIVPREDLLIRVEDYRDNLAKAYSSAIFLGLQAEYPSPETISSLLFAAFRSAHVLASKSGYASPETIRDILKEAYGQAAVVQAAMGAKSG